MGGSITNVIDATSKLLLEIAKSYKLTMEETIKNFAENLESETNLKIINTGILL